MQDHVKRWAKVSAEVTWPRSCCAEEKVPQTWPSPGTRPLKVQQEEWQMEQQLQWSVTKRTLFSRLKVTSQVQLLTFYTHELCLVFMFRSQPQKVREKDLVNDERESVLLVFSTAAFSPRSITALLSASRCTHGTRGVRSMTSLLCSQRCCRRLGKQKHVPKVDRSVSQHNNDKISVSELKGLPWESE